MATIGKIRIYEIARQLGMTNDEVVEKLRARGEHVTSASSTVHVAVAEAFKAKVRADARPRPAVPAVVRRRSMHEHATEQVAGTPSAHAVTGTVRAAAAEQPLELLDVKSRYERELAAARTRTSVRSWRSVA